MCESRAGNGVKVRQMRQICWLIGVLALMGHECAGAQTAWPEYMRSLPRAVSESPVSAELPSTIATLSPDPALPAPLARWSGLWSGWACASGQCDVKLAIRELTSTGARVNYAGSSAQQAVHDEAVGTFEGNELHVPLRTQATLILRLRPDGDMEMSLWRPAKQLLSAGVLSRLPPAYVRRADWIATPWTELGEPVRLELIVHQPAGPGPFPTLIVSHGSTGEGNRPEWFKQSWTSPQLSAFMVARGWQVMYPQRRGRGRSGGLYDEGFTESRERYSCRSERSLPGAQRALADLEVAFASIRARPDVDARRVLLGGVSRGGILSIAFAGSHPQEVLGVLNFVGGWIGQVCPESGAVNATLFSMGSSFAKSTLWLYGEGDAYYSIAHSRSNFDAFIGAGGKGKFNVFSPTQGLGGHDIHADPSLWGNAVDGYLSALPGAATRAEPGTAAAEPLR